jgi:DNA-directed RNA polymerase subunit beta'
MTFVRAGVPLSDRAITPDDILRIQGPRCSTVWLMKFKKYTVCKGKINDKHFEQNT